MSELTVQPATLANDERLQRPPRVVKWKRVAAKRPTSKHRFDVVPDILESWEVHRAQLDDGSVKEILVRCERAYRGTQRYEPSEPPADVLKALGVR